MHVALAGLFLMQRVESEADGSQNTKTGRRKELCAIAIGDGASVTGRVRRVHTMLRIDSLDENGTASQMTARDCSPSSTHIAFEPPGLLSDPPAAASCSLLLPVVSGGPGFFLRSRSIAPLGLLFSGWSPALGLIRELG